MPPPDRRWLRWGRWYAFIAAVGLLAGAVWGLALRPASHTESQYPVPGPTTTQEVRVPLLPGAKPEQKLPGYLLKPQPTKTVTARPQTDDDDESGPDGRQGVVPSDGGTTTGGSPAGGADGESVAPSVPVM